MKKLILTIFCFLILVTNVNAASLCSYEEQRNLEQKAANVNVSYEMEEQILHYIDGDFRKLNFNISIYNITEDIYVVVKSEEKDYEKTFSFADTNDGIASFKWEDLNTITNFTIQVYSSSSTSCPDEKYKTLYLILPRYNSFSNLVICDELSEFYLCQKLVTFDEISTNDFYVQLNDYQNKKINESGEEITEKTFRDKLFEFIDKYKFYMIGGIVLVIGATSVILIIRNKKQRELGL